MPAHFLWSMLTVMISSKLIFMADWTKGLAWQAKKKKLEYIRPGWKEYGATNSVIDYTMSSRLPALHSYFRKNKYYAVRKYWSSKAGSAKEFIANFPWSKAFYCPHIRPMSQKMFQSWLLFQNTGSKLTDLCHMLNEIQIQRSFHCPQTACFEVCCNSDCFSIKASIQESPATSSAGAGQ